MAMAMGSFTIFGSGVLPMVGFEDCDSLFAHRPSRKLVTGKYSVRHFLAIQDVLNRGLLSNVLWIRGPFDPADGMTKHKSDLAPLL